MKKIIFIFAALIAVSCSNSLENLNENIKDPAAVPGETLFTGAQKNIVDQMVDLNVNNNNTKLWSQFLQETTYTDESNYDQTTRNIPEEQWSVFYRDVLRDLDQAAKNIATTTYVSPEDLNTSNKLAIVEILTIYSYSILVETFGNVPYSEAIDIETLSPVYDDGETVYKDLISRLSAAITSLDVSKGSFGSADNIYGGDVASWKKFAASLKLRMGILIADADNALAKSTVETAVATGVFTSNSDKAAFTYLSDAPNTNPIHANLVISGRHDFVAAVTILDIMQPRSYETLDTNEDGVIDEDDSKSVVPGSVTSTDPRMKYYFADNVDGDPSVPEVVYFGGEIGNLAGFNTHTQVSPQVEAATAPGIILDYAEVEFLLAEAAARTYVVGGTAEEHYNKGIIASVLDWGGTMAEATAHMALPHVNYSTALAASTATTPWKEVIGTQRYIALYNRGFEAWTSIRRMDYPLMATPAEAVSGYPNRYHYPIVEQTLNAANWTAASSAIGGDEPETKLFWDKF